MRDDAPDPCAHLGAAAPGSRPFELRVQLGVDAGIEHCQRDAFTGGAFHDSHQRSRLGRGEHDAVYPRGDRRIDDFDLTREVRFRCGPHPFDLYAPVPACRQGAGVDSLPEDVSGGLRYHDDASAFGSLAPKD